MKAFLSSLNSTASLLTVVLSENLTFLPLKFFIAFLVFLLILPDLNAALFAAKYSKAFSGVFKLLGSVPLNILVIKPSSFSI